MASAYPHLTALFQVFHQDWGCEYPDEIAAVRGSMLDQPPAYLRAALCETKRVLDSDMNVCGGSRG